MNWRWLVLGIVLTSIFALIQLPTRFLISWFPPIPATTLSEPTGSIWQGGLCVKSQMLPEKACMDWDWQAQQVLSGYWVWDVSAKTGDVQSICVARVNTATWQIQGLLTAPVGQVVPQWAAWLPAGQRLSEKKIDFSGTW